MNFLVSIIGGILGTIICEITFVIVLIIKNKKLHKKM